MYSCEWKKSNVVPIHKKGDKQTLKSYRPVSLLQICSKIFERLIYNEVFCFFLDKDLISANQSGFKPGDSCINQLLCRFVVQMQGQQIGEYVYGGHAASSYINAAILVFFLLLYNVVFLHIFYAYSEVFIACYYCVILLLFTILCSTSIYNIYNIRNLIKTKFIY